MVTARPACVTRSATPGIWQRRLPSESSGRGALLQQRALHHPECLLPAAAGDVFIASIAENVERDVESLALSGGIMEVAAANDELGGRGDVGSGSKFPNQGFQQRLVVRERSSQIGRRVVLVREHQVNVAAVFAGSQNFFFGS